MRRLMFSLWYWLPRRPPWDTGVPPPQLERVAAAHPLGRALDLGCGTGTSAVYLAERGWSVVGVDFAGRAIAKARARARSAGLSERCSFVVGDVTRLDGIAGPVDLALDVGCLHTLPPDERFAYARGLARLVRRGGTYLLYAFARGARQGVPGLSREDVAATFGAAFELTAVEEGAGWPSAWYTLTRR